MLEPTTISVPNLAARWNQTPSDILEYAAELRLRLLFNFDGLAFDFNDDWLPGGKDARQRRELQSLTDFVKSAEAQFTRRVNGQLSQWESLDSDDAVSLRSKVTTKKQEIQALNDLFDDRDRQRQQKHYRGALTPMPETVDELLRLGFAKHPIQAYRPEGPFKLHTVDGVLFLDGPIVRLESAGVQWKERLEPADMVVSMADVKAIEAATKPHQTAPATDTAPALTPATPAPVEAVGASGGVESDKAGPVDRGWVMKKSALIAKHTHQWKTIHRDFQDASENGLSDAAKAPVHGNWFEAVALNWARQRGKLTEVTQQGPATLSTVWTGKTHTIGD